jgi:transposase InsO family protein
MERITQEAYHRQRMMMYLKKHGNVTETAIRYHTSWKTVNKWRRRWDGEPESLEDHSRRPLHSPRKHTPKEIKLIRRMLKKHCWRDLLLAYQQAKEKGYSRCYGSFKRIASQLRALKPKKKKARKPKPYQRAEYPGQKVQIDVKYVPKHCAVDGRQYYQFTAKDECSRWTYRQMYDEHSTYSAKEYLMELIQRSPFPIRMVQTDNGSEFTNTLLVVKAKHKTLFEEALMDMGIEYHRIRIATPRHNGKVERQHRTDEERFYSRLKMYSLEDGRKQLAVYQKKSNDYIMTCLNMRSPNQVLNDYLAIM